MRRRSSALMACSLTTMRFFAVFRQTVNAPLLRRFPQKCVKPRNVKAQKPLSSLWKVTRSIKPEICSVEGWRSGVAESMPGLHFAMVGVLGRQARTPLAAHRRNAAGDGRINHCAPEAITDGDNPLGMVRVQQAG